MAETKLAVCPHDCPDTCGWLVQVDGGRVVSVKGDPDHPFTRGFLCAKAGHYPSRVHSPQRLTKPLLREGAKGSGRFKEITWQRALDVLQRRLEEAAGRFGPESILPYFYAGHMGLVHRNAGSAFFHKLGASRLLPTICSSTATAGHALSLGSGPSTDVESAAHADLIIIWGSNTLTTNLHAWPFFQEARQRGGRIVVIDPYRNRTAQRADLHIMLRPGSDAALALGLMQVLVDEGRLDRRFIKRHTLGFDEFLPRLADYTPERAQKITGVPAAQIRALARDYAQAKAPFIRSGYGPARQLKGGMAMRTVALLPALVGAFHKKGAGIHRSTTSSTVFDLKRLTRPDLAPPGVRAVNMVQLGDALAGRLQGPPVKLLHVYLCNPAVVAPDSALVQAGLAREDLFVSVQEMFLTETARLADLVLPSASCLEMTDLYAGYGHYYVQMSRPAIPAVGQSRPLLSVFQELAGRLGFSEEVFSAGEEAIIRWLLDSGSPHLGGITFPDLAAGRPLRVKAPANPYQEGFATPSGKVEFYSQAMAEMGLDPLPDGAPSLDPDGLGRYRLQLITPPRREFLNSSFNEVPELVDKAGPATLLMHPKDAEARGIVEGDLVRVFNDRGQCLLVAQVAAEVLPGVCVAEGLYWGVHTPGGQGINHLTSQRLADVGGSNAFHCNLVEAEPVPEAA
ncbi:MAG: molybdopterin oxidoreductase family protein [Desulfarculus sp.]|nr:MAG: molybdopterin oxidoreductase family protein [Desulfarculus sp.]